MRSAFPMVDYAVLFLLLAVVTGILGFGGIVGTAALIAKWLFVVFLALFVVMLLRREKS